MRSWSDAFLMFMVLIGRMGRWLFTADYGGWRELARRFGASKRPEQGDRFRFQNAGMGDIWFRGTLAIIVAPDGLYIKPVFPFDLGFPALLIPWSELHFRGKLGGAWNRYYLIEIGQPMIERLYVHDRAATAIQAKLGFFGELCRSQLGKYNDRKNPPQAARFLTRLRN
jgi:hypothetical protein